MQVHLEPITYNQKPPNNHNKEEKSKKVWEINKVWAATGKFIKSQCNNGKIVDFPLAGKFRKITGEG